MKIVSIFVVLLSLSACDSGVWADVPMFNCKNGKPEGVAGTDAGYLKELGKGTCMTRQKNFTGDSQCNGDNLQVKCK